MMQFTRPPAPAAFVRRASAILAGKAEHRDIWGEYKDDLARAQRNRCGYCDRCIESYEADIDHYRPKGGLHEIDDVNAEAKCCRDKHPVVRELSPAGYDWLRYEWSNYVFSCKRCNQYFKRCIFPVEAGTRRLPLDEAGVLNEKALLLSCYGLEDPGVHLEFAAVGSIAPRNESAHGRATILTCGLSRLFLQTQRKDVCEAAFDAAERLESAQSVADTRPELLQEAVEKCAQRGDASRPFSGVFRIIVTQRLGMAWDEIIALGP